MTKIIEVSREIASRMIALIIIIIRILLRINHLHYYHLQQQDHQNYRSDVHIMKPIIIQFIITVIIILVVGNRLQYSPTRIYLLHVAEPPKQG